MASVVQTALAPACRDCRHYLCRGPDHGQLGFQDALYQSATLHYDHMTADIHLTEPSVRSNYVQQQRLSLTASKSGVRSGWGRFYASGVRQLCGLEKSMDAHGTNDVHVRIQSRSRLLRFGCHQGSWPLTADGRQCSIRRPFPQRIRGRANCIQGRKTRNYRDGGSSRGSGRPFQRGDLFRH